ncbi:glycoside hydrolase family 31 protein [Maribellus maritimus]|uniref:glycoside hydrolase family 31 protein n=1 Tax=Maribellus maritimus TaxID=2870838 RepID=UPI001EE9BD5B|nr:glycoside hydrolase family 31 protein [Maribellus maritimus]MCG6186021.1 glycoside hydrolase family 31 protein [Maribellus maritimus]
MKFRLLFLSFILFPNLVLVAQNQPFKIDLLPGEKIWSGVITDGHKMPLAGGFEFDFYANNQGNQTQPLLLSNKGLYVWSQKPYKFEIGNNEIIISENYGKVEHGRNGTTLKEARQFASEHFFPASGKMPDEMLFTEPQYNTWIELTYDQNQEDILKYAHAIINNGFPPGVFMIDDTWQEDYGLWNFHPGRFPNPRQMMDELHKMGFKVMLWVCPFVSPDQALIVREIMKGKGFLLKKIDETTTWETAREPAIIKWWNGYSALLDFSNPAAVDWFNNQLDRLVNEYGVDGFKLDAGDMQYYPPNAISKENVSPNKQCELYAMIGLRYPLNEYRACWKMAGQPLAQRLRDKQHSWSDMQMLIPHMIAEGLAGYTFSCPDMIGGGEFSSFLDLNSYDEELVVRSAQCHALMPMMQFSVAPWRVLNEKNFEAVKKAVEIRKKFTPLILKRAKESAKTGEPVISNPEYFYPNQGFENIKDEFLLGENLLIAPVYKKEYSREVILPNGTWIADDGKKYKGGKSYIIDVPIDRLPYFEKQ